MKAPALATAGALALAGCASGSLNPDAPTQIGQAVGGAVQTVGTVTGNPLLFGLGQLLTDAIPYVLTLVGGGVLTRKMTKRVAVKEQEREFTEAEKAAIRAAVSEAPKA